MGKKSFTYYVQYGSTSCEVSSLQIQTQFTFLTLMNQTDSFCLSWPTAVATSKLFNSGGTDEMPSLTAKGHFQLQNIFNGR